MKQLLGLFIALILVLCGACSQPADAVGALPMPSAESTAMSS